MTGTIRLSADLFGRHNRREENTGPEKYAIQAYLRSALGTAENWADDPSQYERVWLDHLYAYLVGYLGIPVNELKEMRLKDVFDFLDKSP